MKRRLLNLLTALSLLLCVAVVALWVRSYFVVNTLMHRRVWTGATEWTLVDRSLQCIRGRIVLRESVASLPSSKVAAERAIARQLLEQEGGWFWLRADPRHFSRLSTGGRAVPMWVLAVIFALLPLTRLFLQSRRRYAAGFCPSCGYDLRATPDRCPECGGGVEGSRVQSRQTPGAAPR